MARVLIVGCGCRGRELAAALVSSGHAVSGTTRDPARLAAIAASGAEPKLADPDRIGTLMESLAGVTVVCWLLGTATGERDSVGELHGNRLSMLFERLVDTPVRGVLYEAAGPLPAEHYEHGRSLAAAAHATWRIPVVTLDADPGSHADWLRAATAGVEDLLTPRALGR
jgi:hypothetical protein